MRNEALMGELQIPRCARDDNQLLPSLPQPSALCHSPSARNPLPSARNPLPSAQNQLLRPAMNDSTFALRQRLAGVLNVGLLAAGGVDDVLHQLRPGAILQHTA